MRILENPALWGPLAAAALLLLALFGIYRSPVLQFRLMHLWMNFPFIGHIARRSHLKYPNVSEANKEMDNIFYRYRSHIGSRHTNDYMNRAFKYLHIAGDADTKRASIWVWGFLAGLLVVESIAFSLLLALRIAPYVSEESGFRVALGLASILALVLAYIGHSAGKSLHRARALARALPEAIDEEAPLPAGETKTMADLTARVSLDEDQDRDKGTSRAFDSQRFLNRVQKQDNERPNFVVGYGYWAVMLLLALFIFFLRDTEAVVTSANRLFFEQAQALEQAATEGSLGLPAAGNAALGQADASASWWANLMLSTIFLLTQAVVFWIGYHGALLGQHSKSALNRTAGFHSYEDYENAFESKMLKADQSLTHMLNRIKRNHPRLNPDQRLYSARLRTADQSHDNSGGDPPAPVPTEADDPAAAAGSNVIQPSAFGGLPK